MIARVAKVAIYRNRETDRYDCKELKGYKVQTLIERQVWLQGFQSSQGTETDRQVWFQALQRLRGTETSTQTGMGARVAIVARYRDI